jgi:PKD repeat protein
MEKVTGRRGGPSRGRKTHTISVLAVVVFAAVMLLASVLAGSFPNLSASGPASPPHPNAVGAAVSNTGSATWTNLTGNVTGFPLPNGEYPGSIDGCAGLLAFDARDNYTVYLAGGGWGWQDTLTYRDGQWTNLTGIQGPPFGSYGCSQMAYDPALGGIVYIPANGVTPWFFQAGAWSKLTTTNYTGGVSGGGGIGGEGSSVMMTYDSVDGYLLASNGNQTWSLGSNLTWTGVASLPQDYGFTYPYNGNTVQPMMTYDAHDHYVLAINFGGYSYSYSGGTWANLSANGTNSPTEFGVGAALGNNSQGQSLAYDPTLSSVVLFGGMCYPNGQDGNGCSGRLVANSPFGYNATWVYQSGTWTNLTHLVMPTPRAYAGMTYDAADGYMLLVGGENEMVGGVSTWQQTWAFSNKTVIISPVGPLSLSARPNPTDAGTPVTISVSFHGGTEPFTYLWSNGAKSNQTEETYAAAGTYSVNITVTDAVGTHQTGTLNVTVNPSPTASFTFASDQTTGIPETFSASDSNGTGPFHYSWNFGDNTTALSRSGSHNYARPGNYTVMLVTTDSLNQSSTARETVTVASVIAASLSVTNATPSIEQSILFTANVSGGLGAYTFAWSGLPFGCNSVNRSSIGCAPTQSGTYVVTVDVTDAFPGVGNATVRVSVIFEFTLSVSTVTPQVGQNVIVGVQSATPGTDLTYSYSGLPPGCVSANTPELTCTPSGTGNYTVTVTVTDVAARVSTSRTFSLDVVAANISPVGTGTTTNSYVEPLVVGLALGAVVGAAVAIFLKRRGRKPPGPTKPPFQPLSDGPPAPPEADPDDSMPSPEAYEDEMAPMS